MMEFKNTCLNFLSTISSLYWGADLDLLNYCVEDRRKFIRIEILIIIISIFSFIMFNYVAWYSTLMSLCIFASYKWFLSSLDFSLSEKQWGFLKFVVGTINAAVIWLYTLEYFHIHRIKSNSDLGLILFIGLIIYILCLLPIRFKKNVNSQYAKLYKEQIKNDEQLAERYVKIVNEAKQQRINDLVEIQRKSYQDYYIAVSSEILAARLRLAKDVLAKWEEEQKKKIESNLADYMKS